MCCPGIRVVSRVGMCGLIGICVLAWSATSAAQTGIGSTSRTSGSSGGLGGNTLGGNLGGNALGGGSSGFGINSGSNSSGFGINSGSNSSGFGINSGSSGFSGGSMLGSSPSGGFGGGSNLGGAGYGGGIGGGNSGGVSRNNPLASYYSNPLQAGVSGGNTRAAFGTPLYGTSNYNTGAGLSTGAGNRTPGAGFGASGAGYGAGGAGYGSASNSTRAPRYTAGVDLSYRPALSAGRPPTDVVQVLARATVLSPERDIQASMDGPVLVLKGTVANEHDRRLAEGMVRLSPGVNDVRNELKVLETLPSPRTER